MPTMRDTYVPMPPPTTTRLTSRQTKNLDHENEPNSTDEPKQTPLTYEPEPLPHAAGSDQSLDDNKRINDALDRALEPFDYDIDMDLQDKIDSVPPEDEDLINHVLAILQKHIAEVYSPPRITKLAHEHRLEPGSAFDITINDENGAPWDFDIRAQRERCKD